MLETNVPKLRFKEFEGEWVEKSLDTICKIERGRFSPRPRNNPIYYNGDIPFVQTSDVVKAKGRIVNYSQTLNNQGLKVSKKFTKGTILITVAANIGYAGVLEIDMACPDSLIGLTVYADTLNYFLNYLLEIEQKRMEYLAVDNAQKNINIEFLKPYNFFLPKKLEQQKIANFLISIDKKIEQLTQNKALLESYKKGVMQKIFSQEIRFKYDDNWIEVDYGKIYSFFSTNSFSRDKLNYENGLVKNIHYGDIHKKFSTLFDITKENVPFINRDMNLSKIKDESYCQEGDLVVADASEDYADIGKTIEIKKLDNNKVLAGLHTFLARPDKEKVSIGYMGYLLQSWKVRKQVMTISQGTKVLSLSTRRLAKVKLDLPSKSEQTKIANFLTSIDKRIEGASKQLEETKKYKKALLQQMFI